jgi:hypothetical protein
MLYEGCGLLVFEIGMFVMSSSALFEILHESNTNIPSCFCVSATDFVISYFLLFISLCEVLQTSVNHIHCLFVAKNRPFEQATTFIIF